VAKRVAVFDGLHVKTKPHPRQGFNGLMQVALGRPNERIANSDGCKSGPLGTPGRTNLSTNGTCQLERTENLVSKSARGATLQVRQHVTPRIEEIAISLQIPQCNSGGPAWMRTGRNARGSRGLCVHREICQSSGV
jgi:hypothetical protein